MLYCNCVYIVYFRNIDRVKEEVLSYLLGLLTALTLALVTEDDVGWEDFDALAAATAAADEEEEALPVIEPLAVCPLPPPPIEEVEPKALLEVCLDSLATEVIDVTDLLEGLEEFSLPRLLPLAVVKDGTGETYSFTGLRWPPLLSVKLLEMSAKGFATIERRLVKAPLILACIEAAASSRMIFATAILA